MFWRKFKLDWHYAIGELVIVTLGVLVALGIQQWNEGRLERQEEIEILDRLLVDLAADEIELNDMVSATTAKEESLDRVENVFASGASPFNADRFLRDIVIGANYGWNQASARSRTFDEILSTGNFALVREIELRGTISDYYSSFDDLYTRADARETNYPHISYRLIPRSRESDSEGALRDAEKADIAGERNDQLVRNVLSSEIRDYVIAEKNLARFILRRTTEVLEDHHELVVHIQAYRESLEN